MDNFGNKMQVRNTVSKNAKPIVRIKRDIPVETVTVPNTAGQTNWVEDLGKGSYGMVHKSLTSTGEYIAVKICENTGESSGISNMKEIDMLVRLNKSPFVVYIENICFIHPFKNKEVINNDMKLEKVSIFMEYIEQSGDKFFKNKNLCTPLVAQKLFLQLLIGKISIDNQRIIHRDIKPENLLIGKNSDGDFFAKICDFGLSQIDSLHASKTHGVVTYPYRPPEVCAELEYNSSVDTWSIACTAFEMFGTTRFIGEIKNNRSCRKTLSEIICKLPTKPTKEKLSYYEEYIKEYLIPDVTEFNDTARKMLEGRLFNGCNVSKEDLIKLFVEINDAEYKNVKKDFSKNKIFNLVRQKKKSANIEKDISNFLETLKNKEYDIYPSGYELHAYDIITTGTDVTERNNCLTHMCMTNQYMRLCKNSNVDLEKLDDLLNKMLDLDYVARYNCQNCIDHPFFDNIRTYANNLLEEVEEKIARPVLDVVNIYPCIERQWAFQIVEDVRKSTPTWFNYRIIFHAIELFDRYLHYAFTNPDTFNLFEREKTENGKVVRGKLHTYHDTALRFYACIYIFYKYFTSWTIDLSWSKFVPEELGTEECTKLFVEFEIFLFIELSECEIFRQTFYEVADGNVELTNSMIGNILKYYGDKNLKSIGECSIRAHLRKIIGTQ